jgi:iron complex transport system ATP-binding protein
VAAALMSDEMIALAGVRFSYNGREKAVLQDLSLTLPAGAITAILGPNGSGKTTLLHLILGVLSPQGGAIRLAGLPQAGYSRRQMSQLIGLVPQEEYSPFDFSVLEYVLLGRAPYLGPLEMPGEADYRLARAALQTTGLTHLQDRPIPNLSGGERQLAAVARALAQQPRILLLDEPTAHLDLGNKARIIEILRSLAGKGVAIVLTTHDPEVAAAIAGFVVLMRRGEVLAAGEADTVLTAEQLSATYGVEVRVFQIEGRRVILLA